MATNGNRLRCPSHHWLDLGGIVAEDAGASAASGESRRRVFALTERGRKAAEGEARRRAESLRVARRKGLLPREASS